MKHLIINTDEPWATQRLLEHYELAEHSSMTHVPGVLVLAYPDDVLSQEMVFWLALAQGCGLIHDYGWEAIER